MAPTSVKWLFWSTTMLCCIATQGVVKARVVTVSPGPLIRVEGQPVSVRCEVTEYGGPREQDFEWMRSLEASADRTTIISTFDPSFSHASLSQRVASGDLSVSRLTGSQVELKISEVRMEDSSYYWCQTPSTDSVISGNYEAKVQLIVISNTLKVSPVTPPPVVPEGSDVTLSCNVTRELSQPTYQSVSWAVKKKGATAATEDILIFGPQGDVIAGSNYTQRYADGGLRLVPGRNGLFELVLSRVTNDDEGMYQCSGAEWTHERGGTWIKIMESVKEMGSVAVTPTAPPTPPHFQLVFRLLCHLLVFCPYCVSTVLMVSLYRHRHRGKDLPVSMGTTPPTQAEQGLDDDYDDVTTEHHF